MTMNDDNAVRAQIRELDVWEQDIKRQIDSLQSRCQEIQSRLDEEAAKDSLFRAWLDTIEDKSLRMRALKLRSEQYLLDSR